MEKRRAADDAQALRRALVERFEFLRRLPDDERGNLLRSAVFRRVTAGTMTADENTPSGGIALVLSGDIRVYKSSADGRELLLYHVGPGGICAATAVCLIGGRGDGRGDLSPVSAVAVRDSVLAWIPADTFRYEYAVSPYLQQFVCRVAADRFCRLIRLVNQMAFESVAERLLDFLKENTGDGRRPLYVTHAQLAAAVGASREVVTRRLNEMERKGWIYVRRGKITLAGRNEGRA